MAPRWPVNDRCKTLLDTGRLRYLEEHGYHARLQQYVGAATTPENVVLVASPTPTGASGVV